MDSHSLLEWFANGYKGFGATLEIITDKSQEGAQFVKGFGGIGGLLTTHAALYSVFIWRIIWPIFFIMFVEYVSDGLCFKDVYCNQEFLFFVKPFVLLNYCQCCFSSGYYCLEIIL